MWQLLLEVGAEILLLFEDFKFWKKKRARRRFEKEHGLPKRTMVYPSDYYAGIVVVVLILSAIIFLFFINPYLDTEKQREKIAELELLLNSEKKHIGVYPTQLKEVIRKNPLRSTIIFDVWGNEYHYEVTNSGKYYVLQSKGKDGILNTEDDIE